MLSRANRIKLLIYMLLSVGVLFFGSIRRLTNNYVGQTTQAEVFGRIQSYFDSIVQSVDSANSVLSTLIILFFWSAVGAALYVILWLAFSVIRDYLFEIEVSLFYIHPNSFKESSHWLAVISRETFRIAASVLAVGYVVVLIKIVYPALLDQFISGLITQTTRSIAINVIGSIILMSAAFYLLSFFIRVIFPKSASVDD